VEREGKKKKRTRIKGEKASPKRRVQGGGNEPLLVKKELCTFPGGGRLVNSRGGGKEKGQEEKKTQEISLYQTGGGVECQLSAGGGRSLLAGKGRNIAEKKKKELAEPREKKKKILPLPEGGELIVQVKSLARKVQYPFKTP